MTNLENIGSTMSPWILYHMLMKKIPPTLFKFKSPWTKEARGGKRLYNPDTTHMIISIGPTSIIRLWTVVFLYITKLYLSYTWSSQIIIKISLIITGTFDFMMRGGEGENPNLNLSYIGDITYSLLINWSLTPLMHLTPTSCVISFSASATTIINMIG